MTTSVQLCSAHRLQAEETTKWKEKAGKILEIVAVLTAGGTSLGDAIKLMLQWVSTSKSTASLGLSWIHNL